MKSEESNNKISVLVAIIMNVNIMVGAGIFISPPQMAQTAGSYSYLGWLLSALIFLPVVYASSQLSSHFPGEGGLYSYARRGLGKTAGFFCGWACRINCMAMTS